MPVVRVTKLVRLRCQCGFSVSARTRAAAEAGIEDHWTWEASEQRASTLTQAERMAEELVRAMDFHGATQISDIIRERLPLRDRLT